MDIPTVIQVDEVSRIAEVRRAVLLIAEREGLDETAVSNSAIVATELATNLAKYATRGEIHVLPLTSRGMAGVEIISIDQGPGMANVQQSLVDGYSTSQTSGTGLGAVQRLSSQLEVYSSLGRGTVLMSRIVASAAIAPSFIIGIAAKPFAGEVVSGDSWSVRFGDGFLILMVADGLGHGAFAGDASQEAVRCFKKAREESPLELLQRVHSALKGTRGAAVSIAKIEFVKGIVTFAGLGNVAGVVINAAMEPPHLQSMVSHNGTAGHEARHMKEFTYKFAPEDMIVMHSDGLSGHWNLPTNPGLLRRHPSLIAGTLYRDYARHRDDVCVVVGKRA